MPSGIFPGTGGGTGYGEDWLYPMLLALRIFAWEGARGEVLLFRSWRRARCSEDGEGIPPGDTGMLTGRFAEGGEMLLVFNGLVRASRGPNRFLMFMAAV